MKQLFQSALAALLMTFVAASSYANNLTVLRMGAPGANTDFFTTPMAQHLKEKGWDTQVITFPDCKGAEAWVARNPNEPVLFMMWSDDFVLQKVQPSSPRNCPTLTVTKDTLVTIAAEGNHMVCSLGDLALSNFMDRTKTAKIGLWNHPVQMAVMQDLLNDLNLDHKLIGFAKGADFMQALVAGDVGYLVVSSENLIRNVKGNCFLISADSSIASRIPTLKNSAETITSTQTFGTALKRANTGLWPVYVARNTDINKLRLDVSEILKTAPEYASAWTSAYRLGGFAGGDTHEQQWTKLNNFLNSFEDQ